jgi:hypothetical protein
LSAPVGTPTAVFHFCGVTTVYGTPQAARAIFKPRAAEPEHRRNTLPGSGRGIFDEGVIRIVLAQPATERGAVNLMSLGIARDWHIKQDPLPVATKRERAGNARIDAEDAAHCSALPLDGVECVLAIDMVEKTRVDVFDGERVRASENQMPLK